MKYSDCCGAPAGDFEDVGICPDCREHCEWEDDGEDDEEEETETNKTNIS